MINDVSISVNCWPLSAKLASFMTRPIVDWFSELVFYKSQIGPGRKSLYQKKNYARNVFCRKVVERLYGNVKSSRKDF